MICYSHLGIAYHSAMNKRNQKEFKFWVPMVWRSPQIFLRIFLVSMLKNRAIDQLSNLPSAIRRIPHSVEVPAPEFNKLDVLSKIDDFESTVPISAGKGNSIPVTSSHSEYPQLFNYVRD